VFAVPNAFYRERAEAKRGQAEEALTAHFGVRVRVLVVEDEVSLETPVAVSHVNDDALTAAEVANLEVADAPAPRASAEDQVRQAFPGAEEIP
jgi:hypothetical protein